MSKIEVYNPTPYSFGELKNALQTRRQVKRAGNEIDLRGRKSVQFSERLQAALCVADRMMEVHEPWIEEKIDTILPYFTNGRIDEEGDGGNTNNNSIDPRNRIIEAYYSGLVPVLTQEYKVGRGYIDSDRTSGEAGLDEIIAGYTVDFYRMLRVCQRRGINPNTALRLAQLSHNHNPNVLIQLSTDDRYKDLNPSVISAAALGNPKNPEAFLDGFREKGLLEYVEFWGEFVNQVKKNL